MLGLDSATYPLIGFQPRFPILTQPTTRATSTSVVLALALTSPKAGTRKTKKVGPGTGKRHAPARMRSYTSIYFLTTLVIFYSTLIMSIMSAVGTQSIGGKFYIHFELIDG